MYHLSDQKCSTYDSANRPAQLRALLPAREPLNDPITAEQERSYQPRTLRYGKELCTFSVFLMGKIWPCKDSWMHPSLSTPLPDPCFRTSFHLSHSAVSSLPSVFGLSCTGLTTTLSLRNLHSGVPVLFLASPLHWSSQKVNDSQMCHVLQCFCVFLLIYLLFCIWPEAFPLFFYQSISTPIRSSTWVTTP